MLVYYIERKEIHVIQTLDILHMPAKNKKSFQNRLRQRLNRVVARG